MIPAVEVDLQVALEVGDLYVPDEKKIASWAASALDRADYEKPDALLSVRIVDRTEIQDLNKKYRNIDKTTNVLSFPYDALPDVDLNFIGDIVACAGVINEEAVQQSKPAENHWAHMVVHSVLHLVGYDHMNVEQADEMESLEIDILSNLRIPNPYGEIDTP